MPPRLTSIVAFASLVMLSLPPAASAEPPALLRVEARAGGGLAFGGGAGRSSYRLAPIELAALIDYAIGDAPDTSLYGGLVLETRGRAAAGATVGMRLRPRGSRLRFGGGVLGFAVPYTLVGISASGGVCGRGPIAPCVELEGIAFIAGADLPDDRVAGQVQLALALSFDAM